MTAHPTLSAQGLAVLRALATTTAYDGVPAGQLRTRALVRIVAHRGTSIGVTRASLSRTLRRLWRAGLVELIGGWNGDTLTHRVRAQRRKLANVEADPAAAYERHRALLEACPGLRCESLDAFMAGQRRRLQRTPDLHATRVRITTAGRKAVNKVAAGKLTGRRGHARAS